MDDLIAFLSARLDEDEAAAKAATDGPWYADGSEIRGHNRVYAGGEPGILVVKHTWPQESAHILRHDPARVLREVEAKRAVLTEYARVAKNEGLGEPEYAYGWADGLGMAVRTLASAYRDHPDCRPQWKP